MRSLLATRASYRCCNTMLTIATIVTVHVLIHMINIGMRSDVVGAVVSMKSNVVIILLLVLVVL